MKVRVRVRMRVKMGVGLRVRARVRRLVPADLLEDRNEERTAILIMRHQTHAPFLD